MTPNYVLEALTLFDGYRDGEAVVYLDRRLSYRDLADGVRRMAATLRGTTGAVAVLAGNPPEVVMAQLALHLLGRRTVWIAPNAPIRLTADYLKQAEVGTFIFDSRTHSELGAQLAGPDLTALHFGPDGELSAVPEGSVGAVLGGEPESIFQTGGTTGRPKLVWHRHDFYDTLLAGAARYKAAGHPTLRHIGQTPFWHASAQAAALMTLFTGGTLVLLDRFEAGQYLRIIEAERINSAILPPPMLYKLLDHPDLPGTDVSSLDNFYCGGSAIAPTRLAEAVDRFGSVMTVSYGMSEATSIASYPMAQHDPAHPERLACCGKPNPAAKVEIRSGGGLPVRNGEIGEVWAQVSLMTSGYWGQPELTAQTLVDGWLRTGDVGYLDQDGYLFLVDRVKDMIVTGLTSTNVYSRTVEDVLVAHPRVRAAAVIGVPDEHVGEAVHAVVEATVDEVTPEELRRWAIDNLNELWAPATVEIVDRLPLTDMGKVDKKALRASLAT